jgi:hypothetical protein
MDAGVLDPALASGGDSSYEQPAGPAAASNANTNDAEQDAAEYGEVQKLAKDLVQETLDEVAVAVKARERGPQAERYRSVYAHKWLSTACGTITSLGCGILMQQNRYRM